MSLNTTFAAGDTLTAGHMNGLQAAWEAYTPSWTGASSNPVIGDGAIVGRYLRVGKAIDLIVVITMGSTTSYGTGQWRITPPVTPRSGVRWSLQVESLNSGVNQYTGRAVCESGSYFAVFTSGSPDAAVTSSAPFTWGSTDVLTVVGRYEAA